MKFMRLDLFAIIFLFYSSAALGSVGNEKQIGSTAALAQTVEIEFQIAAERTKASDAQQIQRRLTTLIGSKERLLAAINAAKGVDCGKNASSLSHQYDIVVGILSSYFPLTNDINKTDQQAPAMPFANFFAASQQDRCKILQSEDLVNSVDSLFIELQRLEKNYENEYKNAAKSIAAYEDDLRQSLTDQSVVSNISRNLPLILGIVAVFAIGIILSIKLFDKEIQMEWVSSGQVIQFTTVLILLSALMALGLTQIIQEQVLGTLLGGIAGYVLAQGVGRATARATLNATREANTTIPISAAQNLAAVVAGASPTNSEGQRST